MNVQELRRTEPWSGNEHARRLVRDRVQGLGGRGRVKLLDQEAPTAKKLNG